MSAATTNKDNHTRIGKIGCEGHKVVAVASDQKQILLPSVPEHLEIGRLDRQDLSQFGDLVLFLTQHPSNFGRYVMVEEELHNSELICRATNVSISAR
jgi:hypothetical protein